MITFITKPSKNQIEEISLLSNRESILSLSTKDIEKAFKMQQGIAATNEDNIAVGFIRFMDCGTSKKQGKHVFEIGSWVVAPSERGRGIGKQLFISMVKHINSLYDNALIVDVTRKSNADVCQILEKMGAKKIAKPDNMTLYPLGADEKLFYFFDVSHFT